MTATLFKPFRHSCVAAAYILAGTTCALAAPAARLPSIFTDGMVLQAGKPVQVWGFDSAPGLEISVSLTQTDSGEILAKTTVKADDAGKFSASLPSMGYKKEAMSLSVSSPGAEDVLVQNVLSGEVWVCSGQSNMAWLLSGAENGKAAAEAATNSLIRLLTAGRKLQLEPAEDFEGQWKECNPRNALNFSAIGYLFGEELHRELPENPPVGLINVSWGGMNAQAFISYSGLEANGLTKQIKEYTAIASATNDTSPAAFARYESQMEAHKASTRFEDKNPPQSDSPELAALDYDDSDWSVVDVPTSLEKATGDDAFNGAVWFRRTVEIPENWSGKGLLLELGVIDDFDTAYFNGALVGKTDKNTPRYWTHMRQYPVSGDKVKPGKATIAVRVLDNFLGGAFGSLPLRLSLESSPTTDTIELAGEWKFKVDYKVTEVPPPLKPGEIPFSTPGGLYNGMISPVVNYPVAGAIWYQGEADATGFAEEYPSLFKALINDWRTNWKNPEMPFLWCQLANFGARHDSPVDPSWANLRHAQSSALELPFTAQAVIADVGEAGNIHPKDKQTPAHRLVLGALHVAYGMKDVVHSGPTVKSVTAKNGSLIVEFDNVAGGLVAKEGTLKGFAVAGGNGVYAWAEARIDGNNVVVSTPKVASPVSVRYAWDDDPEITLYNAAGLPASPFQAK